MYLSILSPRHGIVPGPLVSTCARGDSVLHYDSCVSSVEHFQTQVVRKKMAAWLILLLFRNTLLVWRLEIFVLTMTQMIVQKTRLPCWMRVCILSLEHRVCSGGLVQTCNAGVGCNITILKRRFCWKRNNNNNNNNNNIYNNKNQELATWIYCFFQLMPL